MRINNKNKNVLLRFFILLSFCLGLPVLAEAKVSGSCANCHTMHNSQDGAAQVHISTGSSVRWSGDGGVLEGPLGSPQSHLLKTSCVGCHSSADSATIVSIGSTDIPIVWNIGGTQIEADELAGGNFSHVVDDERKGHNVAGISPVDTILSGGPPGRVSGWGCGNSCHVNLVDPVTEPGYDQYPNGCQGCHLVVGHHDNPYEDATNPGPEYGGGDAYRFLGGHTGGLNNIVFNGDDASYEDPDWEQTTSPSDGGADYNIYGRGVNSTNPMNIGRFCAGCHPAFHAYGDVSGLGPHSRNEGDRDDIVGSTSASWLRHPTNVDLPTGGASGEFSGLVGQPYDPRTPLGRSLSVRSLPINQFDQVICLSCHKAHGTQYADMLRFSYSTMDAHSGANRTTGCFFCHRAKDS